jgi:TolB-like protein
MLQINLFRLRINQNNNHVSRALRRLATVCVFAGLGGLLYAQTPVTLDEGLKQIAASIEDRLDPDTKIIVLDFQTTLDSQRLSEYVVDELSTFLINGGKLDVLDRKNLALIDEEMTFQASGEVSDSSAQSFGQRLGAQAIISGNMEDLGEYYRIRFRTLQVETARTLGILSANVRKNDAQIARLTQGKTYMDTKKVAFGAAVSWGLGLYSVDDLAENYGSASLISANNLLASVWAAFNLTPRFALQLEVNLMNNGLIIDGTDQWLFDGGWEDDDGSTYFPTSEESQIKDWFRYTSVDIPVLLRVNFRPRPFLLLGVSAGAYVSLPVSDIENEYHYPYFAQINSTKTFKISNMQYGIVAGVTAGLRAGPGYITARARYRGDLVPVIVDEYGNNIDVEMFTRRLIAVSVGYELWI